jgi:hypothetical protein
MKTLLSLAFLLVLTTLSAYTINADIPKPKPPDQQSSQQSKYVLSRRLEIVPDSSVWQARLQLSQSDLQELRAALNDAAGSNTTIVASIGQSPARTIVAGVLLFLSVSFAGVWLARRPAATRTRKAVAAGILVVAVLSAAAIITRGNAGPPPGYLSWKELPKNFSKGLATSGHMVIEVVPDNPNNPPGIKLLLPSKPKEGGDE